MDNFIDSLQITDNKTIIKVAEKWVRTPFRWHGITKKGCDCSGLIIGVLNDLNAVDKLIMLEVQRFHYGNNLKSVNKGALLMLLLLKFEIVDDIENADLLMLETKHSPIHFAFYNQKTKQIIHSTRNQGVVNNNFDKTQYTTMVCFRLKNQTENKTNE